MDGQGREIFSFHACPPWIEGLDPTEHITSSTKQDEALSGRPLLPAAGRRQRVRADRDLDYHENVGIPKAEAIRQAELAADFDGSRIVGGSTVSRLGEWPFIGGLVISLTDGRQSVCGSSLLSATKLVTAAHCWRTHNVQARQFTVVLGSLRLFSGGTRINTNRVEMHSSYNMNTLEQRHRYDHHQQCQP
ncbi:Trypsin-4 [Papilio xuthus]|uniref:Trypsin-4 n=1 Tax=Papilio xuthus TaxID=66420 RepID=A0A0N0PAM8_PAPXU|nr:Trypsin-4 [Papilio xuthus]